LKAAPWKILLGYRIRPKISEYCTNVAVKGVDIFRQNRMAQCGSQRAGVKTHSYSVFIVRSSSFFYADRFYSFLRLNELTIAPYDCCSINAD
jgi:hypothetical protein